MEDAGDYVVNREEDEEGANADNNGEEDRDETER